MPLRPRSPVLLCLLRINIKLSEVFRRNACTKLTVPCWLPSRGRRRAFDFRYRRFRRFFRYLLRSRLRVPAVQLGFWCRRRRDITRFNFWIGRRCIQQSRLPLAPLGKSGNRGLSLRILLLLHRLLEPNILLAAKVIPTRSQRRLITQLQQDPRHPLPPQPLQPPPLPAQQPSPSPPPTPSPSTPPTASS